VPRCFAHAQALPPLPQWVPVERCKKQPSAGEMCLAGPLEGLTTSGFSPLVRGPTPPGAVLLGPAGTKRLAVGLSGSPAQRRPPPAMAMRTAWLARIHVPSGVRPLADWALGGKLIQEWFVGARQAQAASRFGRSPVGRMGFRPAQAPGCGR